MKTKRKFKRGDKIRLCDDPSTDTIVNHVEWCDTAKVWKYWFKDENDKLLYATDLDCIELVPNIKLDYKTSLVSMSKIDVKTSYDIGIDEDNKPTCKFIFQWFDNAGMFHDVNTNDIDEAQIVMSLLSGETCIADYEEDKNS